MMALLGRDKKRTLELVHKQSLSIVDRLAGELTGDQISFLKKRGEHFEARWKLPRSRLMRLPGVLAEYRSGRYDQMSLGLRSVIRDLLRVI